MNEYAKQRKSDGKLRDANEKKRICEEPAAGYVIGRSAVGELLGSGRAIDKIFVKRGERNGSLTVIAAEAIERGIPLIETETQKLDKMSGGRPHQGVVACAAIKEYSTIDDMLALAEQRNEKPLLLIADGIEDPQNLGAMIRSAECNGAHGVIIPKRHAAGLTDTVSKASAGAIEHMLIAKVPNLAAAVEELKEKGVWIYCAEAGGVPYYECDMNSPAAFILGSEGNGVSRLLREKSDFIVSIPMYGEVNSLNVSAAAAVMLCEAARQTRAGNK